MPFSASSLNWGRSIWTSTRSSWARSLVIFGPGHLDPVELDVVFGLQLQAEDQFQFLQRRDLLLEALDGES